MLYMCTGQTGRKRKIPLPRICTALRSSLFPLFHSLIYSARSSRLRLSLLTSPLPSFSPVLTLVPSSSSLPAHLPRMYYDASVCVRPCISSSRLPLRANNHRRRRCGASVPPHNHGEGREHKSSPRGREKRQGATMGIGEEFGSQVKTL